MWKDHIVEEVRKARKEHALKLNCDINAIIEDARKRQKTSKHKVVSFILKKRNPHKKALQPVAKDAV